MKPIFHYGVGSFSTIAFFAEEAEGDAIIAELQRRRAAKGGEPWVVFKHEISLAKAATFFDTPQVPNET